MSLDRDELAARVLVALVARDYPSADTARFAVNMADALLARLRPEAVAPAPSRPEWVPKVGDRVRVTRDKADYADVECGDEFVVSRIVRDDGAVSRQLVYGLPSGEFIRVENLEPCAAPGAAPSPAPSPAAWAPSVGDVVTWGACELVYRVETVTAERAYVRCCDGRGNVGDLTEIDLEDPHGLRRATPAERAAAGLPVDESATKPVDREGLAKAIYEAVRAGNLLMGARKWDDVPMVVRNDSLNAADAAIAYLKANGGVA